MGRRGRPAEVVAVAGVADHVAAVRVPGAGAEAVGVGVAHLLDRANPVGAVGGIDRGRTVRPQAGDEPAVAVSTSAGGDAPRVDGDAVDGDGADAHTGGGGQTGETAQVLDVDRRPGPVGLVQVLGHGAQVRAVHLVGVCTVLDAVPVVVHAGPIGGVGVAVAVVVQTVRAVVHLGEVVGARGVQDEVELDGSSGVGVCAGVVAVGVVLDVARGLVAVVEAVSGVAVAIEVVVRVPGGGVGRLLVDASVAVVVDAVAGLGGAGAHTRIVVVAVTARAHVARGGGAGVRGDGGIAVAVGVGVVVPRGGVHRGGLVDRAVAVVVVGGRAVLVCAGVHPRTRVVAVGVVEHVARGRRAGLHRGGRLAVPVAVRIAVVVRRVRGTIVHRTVAVVVDAVAGLGGAGVHVRVGVVAVGVVEHSARRLRAGRIVVGAVAESVTIRVGVPVAPHGVVGGVAVIVDAVVADLGFAGVHVDVGIVAVGLTGDVARGGLAGILGDGRATEPVTVHVGVPGGVGARVDVARCRADVVVIDATVTVVVDATIADLDGPGADVRVGVVAVGVLRDVAHRLDARVHAVVLVSEAVGVLVGVPGLDETLVDLAVAVVVGPVAGLGGAGVHVRIEVVAVSEVGDVPIGFTARLHEVLFRSEPVTVLIGVPGLHDPFVDLAVAVVVDAVAGLAGVGTHAGVRVVTVITSRPPVAVGVGVVPASVTLVIEDDLPGLAPGEDHQDGQQPPQPVETSLEFTIHSNLTSANCVLSTPLKRSWCIAHVRGSERTPCPHMLTPAKPPFGRNYHPSKRRNTQ